MASPAAGRWPDRQSETRVTGPRAQVSRQRSVEIDRARCGGLGERELEGLGMVGGNLEGRSRNARHLDGCKRSG